MLSEINSEDLPLNLNHGIIEILEKYNIKNIQSGNASITPSNLLEKKDKNIIEIFQYYLSLLNKKLNNSNPNEITDIIIDKSQYISETLSIFEWPTAESLKVPNLHKLAVIIYNYIKSRVALLCSKNKKSNIKDLAIKATNNLKNLLTHLIDDNLMQNLENNLLFIFFKDLFSFYQLSDFDNTVKEELECLVDIYKEESNISGLAKLKKIEKTAENNFFIGALITIFVFKCDLATANSEMDLTDLNNVYNHHDTLVKLCFLCDCDLEWLMCCYKFIKDENMDLIYYKNAKKLIDESKSYYTFLKGTNSKLIDFISYYVNLLRTFILFGTIKNNIKLNENILSALNYEPYEMEVIINSSCSNISPVKKILKSNFNSIYQILKFDEPIIKKIIDANNNGNNTQSQELRNILLKINVGDDINSMKNKITDKNYLNNKMHELNDKFDGILKDLN